MTAPLVFMPQTLEAWHQGNTCTLREAFIAEAGRLHPAQLPLQAGLARSSSVANSPFSVLMLGVEETSTHLHIRVGISYSGIIAGCSCADDPTPVDEITEYCEARFSIHKTSAQTQISLLEPG